MPKPKSIQHPGSHEVNEDLNLDPIIVGLLEKMPETGGEWDKQDRQKWIQLFTLTIDYIYKDKSPQPAQAPPRP